MRGPFPSSGAPPRAPATGVVGATRQAEANESMSLQCFGSEQVFVHRDGTVRACCVATEKWYAGGQPSFDGLFDHKVDNNHRIERGDTAACKPDCRSLYEYSGPRSYRPKKVVVWTNTLCPLSCMYCSQAWPNRPGEKPEVQQANNNIENLRALLEKILSQPGAESIQEIELSGGDSALHPEFEEILDMLGEYGTKAVYLSSGVVPERVMPKIREKLAAGDLTISVSPDACSPATWSSVSRKPEASFSRVVDFIDDVVAHAAFQTQLWIKFVVTRQNLHEAGQWVPYWYDRGARCFALSEYRVGQTLDLIPKDSLFDLETARGPSEEELAAACLATGRSFDTLDVDAPSWLNLIGTERFFADETSFYKEPSTAHSVGGVFGVDSRARVLADRLVERGEVLFRDGQPHRAQRLFRRALEVCPPHAHGHNDLAVYLLEHGSRVDAADHLKRALYLGGRDEAIQANVQQFVAAAQSDAAPGPNDHAGVR